MGFVYTLALLMLLLLLIVAVVVFCNHLIPVTSHLDRNIYF